MTLHVPSGQEQPMHKEQPDHTMKQPIRNKEEKKRTKLKKDELKKVTNISKIWRTKEHFSKHLVNSQKINYALYTLSTE